MTLFRRKRCHAQWKRKELRFSRGFLQAAQGWLPSIREARGFAVNRPTKATRSHCPTRHTRHTPPHRPATVPRPPDRFSADGDKHMPYAYGEQLASCRHASKHHLCRRNLLPGDFSRLFPVLLKVRNL